MKKIIIMLMMITLVVSSCKTNQKNEPEKPQNDTVYVIESDTSVVKASIRKVQVKDEPGFNTPDENGNYHVWYFIRIDGNIQDEFNPGMKSEDYFPRKQDKKTMLDSLNMGYIKSDHNWWSNMKFSKYVYDATGKLVNDVIIKQPTIDDLVKASKYKGDNELFAPYVADSANLYCLWYTCKKQDKDGCWHIDGVLTKKNINDIKETSYGNEITNNYGFGGEVEVDIHQQEHKDWDEIKTSIHLRDTVDVEVFIPIEYDYQTVSDDFDIRVGDKYTYVEEVVNSTIDINGIEYILETRILHKSNGIYIEIVPNKEALKMARAFSDDGITYEIHSYLKNINVYDVWYKLKKSSVIANTHVCGQIHSAYYVDSETGEELDIIKLPNL